jgi:Spx/MgsR family transcriptional regulator
MEHSRDHEFHDLRKDGIEFRTLERWSRRISWEKLLNTRSLTWRRLPEVDRAELDKDNAIALMLEHPTLIKRPILESAKFIAVGFSPEHYRKIFDKFG